jgi:hypothetical protein
MNIKFLLEKHLLIIKVVLKASSKSCSSFSSLLLVDSLQCIFMASFRNDLQDHKRLPEQLLVSQAAIRKPKHATEEGYS